MERDENLQNMIQSNRLAYALGLKMAWDVKTWDQKFIKMIQTQELTVVQDFHESKMIHGR